MKMASAFFGDQKAGGKFDLKTVTLEMQVAIKSNLKLDLVDLSPDIDQQKITFMDPSRQNDNEIHFVKFEGLLPISNLTTDLFKDHDKLRKVL